MTSAGTTRSSEPAVLRDASRGDVEAVERFLAAGGKPDHAGPGGETPLMRAAARGHVPVIECLLARGAAIDAITTVGNTALMFAAAGGQLAAVRLLLDRGASPAHRNRYGLGPADWARWSERQAEVLTLLGTAPTA